ncbi:MAG: tRNA lysidine(34) synthetase TilS [Saprospiraceae bacterium]|mgnify:CR=1 FL=1|nr:tRNA lysidine(34) synthetase TilS [Saprospiraceae bacterium]
MSGELSHIISASVRKNLAGCGVTPTSKILVGVSGGVDSMVLLYILHQNGFNVTAAHVNFNLRGAESVNDALFVSRWCLDMGIPYLELSRDTKTYAEDNKLNTQTAARILRYDWWEYLIHNSDYEYVATGHQLDDTIETVFLNLFRGTGLKGLRGIPQSRDFYIRPLLDCSRSSIESFAATFDIPFRTDASNLSDLYQRNRLRHHLIPLLEKFYPGFHSSMQHTLHRVNVEWNDWDTAYEEWISVNIRPLQDGFLIDGHQLRKAFLLRWLEEKGIPWMLASDFLNAPEQETGHILRHHHTALSRTRDGYYFAETQPAADFFILKTGQHSIGNYLMTIDEIPSEEFLQDRDPWTEYMNSDVISWPLHIRSIHPGDHFQPLGMKGRSKKIQDLLVDLKLEMFEKERQLLLANREHILWVVGLRLDDRAKVEPGAKKVYKVKFTAVGRD